MHISIKQLCTQELDCNVSLEFDMTGRIVLYDKQEEISGAILSCFVDASTIRAGSIQIDNLELSQFYQQTPIIKTFGYVFDTGIMLSNLSILENFLLPYQLRWKKNRINTFESQLQKWLDTFELSLDLSLRPAFLKPSQLKLLSFIRAFLLEPKILLIDNPYYLLNHYQRKLVFKILQEQTMPMLIASTDDDFTHSFAETVITFSENGKYTMKKLAKE